MPDDLRYRLGLDGSAASRVLSGLQSGVGGLHGALIGLGAVGVLTKVIKDGLTFNQTLADSESAIAKVLAQFQGLDDVAAKASAAGAMQQLVALEPKAAGTLNTLIDGFLSTLAASQSAGISVKQNIDLVGRFANAMANANIPTEQLGQEMRSIVTANIGADSSLAKVLGITNEMIQQAQAAGNVYEFLSQKIGKLGEAGDTAAVRFSSLESAVQKAEGAFSEGLFKQALEGSLDLTASIDENIDQVRKLGVAVSDLTAGLVKGIGYAIDWGRAIGITAGVYADMLTNGATYAEAMANAENALTEAINERSQAEQAAATAAAQKGASDMGGGGSGGSGATSGRSGKKRKEEDPEDIAEETLKKTQELKELKRKGAEEEMTSAQKIAATRARLLEAAEREMAIKNVGLQDTRAALDAETDRVQIEQELNSLLRDQARETQAAAKAAADKAEAARKEVAARNQDRNNLLGELAVLEQQAKGHDKKAAALERQLKIENDKLAIMKQTGASEEEAMRLATRRADLQDKIARRGARGDDQGNGGERPASKIRGVQARHGLSDNSGPLAGGGLAEFEALQKRKPMEFGTLLPKTSERDQIKLASSSLITPAARASEALSPLPSTSTKSSPEQDPDTMKLEAILAELRRIRTA